MNYPKSFAENLIKLLIFIGVFAFANLSFAMNGRTTYQAKIIKPDGLPLEATNVNFKFSVLDTVGSCLLYSETYSAINMTSTGGLISFALGGGVRSFPAASATTALFTNVFDNSITSMPCESAGIYNPGPNDIRKIVMQFNDGSGWQTLPALSINAVPYAMYATKSNDAKTLNGKADSAFVENATLASLSCNSATHAIAFNGASFSCLAVGSGSGVTSVTTSGTVLTNVGTASSPVITIQAATMSQDGYLTSLDYAEFKAKLSASSTQIVNTLGYAPVSGTTVTSQINNSNLSGDVSGTVSSNTVQSVGGKSSSQISNSVNDTLAATTSATADTLVKRNSLGNATFNDIYANTAKINYVDIYKPTTSFNIRLQVPTSLSSNYVLNLPSASGTIGQVLSTDGSGNLSWVNPSTGSVTSVSATAPLASTGGTTPIISITQATSLTAGYLSAADFNTFNNKQEATSAAIITTLGYTPAHATSATQWATSGPNIYYLTGNIGVGVVNPSAKLELSPGTASLAPLKFTSGTLLTSAQSGTMEYDGFNFYLTDGASNRKAIATGSSVGAIDNTSNINSPGNITMTPTGSVVVSATTASTNSQTGALIVKGGLGVAGNISTAANLNVSGSQVIDGSLRLSLMTSGSVLFAGSSGAVTQDNSNLFWDNANKRLGLGTTNPEQKFHLADGGIFRIQDNDDISPHGYFEFGVTTAGSWSRKGYLGMPGAASAELAIAADGLGTPIYLKNTTGTVMTVSGTNVGIGTTTPGSALDVSGTIRFQNLSHANGLSITSLYSYSGGNTTGNTMSLQNNSLTSGNGLVVNSNNAGMTGNLVNINYTGTGSGKTTVINSTNASATGDVLAVSNKGTGYTARFTAGASSIPVVIDSIGNVGVGTSVPQQRLDVRGSNGSPSVVTNGVLGLNFGGSAALLLGTDDSTLGSEYAWIQSHGSKPLYVNKVGNNTILNALSGNVGVGTSTPTQKLSVAGFVESVSGGFRFPDGSIQASASGLSVRGFSPGNPATSCTDAQNSGFTSSGLVYINVSGTVQQLYCEQTLNGGGYLMLYNSVLGINTTEFWYIPKAQLLSRRGRTSIDSNFYDGSFYKLGLNFMDVIEDLRGIQAIALVATAISFDSNPVSANFMKFSGATRVSGDANIFTSQFASGFAAPDFDNDAHTGNCAADYSNVSQHYGACWAYNLGSDADTPYYDGSVGPHLLSTIATSLGLSSDGTVYTRVRRITRFVKF